MKVLFLIYAPQESFNIFSENARTNFSWVDSLILNLKSSFEFNIALAVPIDSDRFQKSHYNGITLFGLPDPKRKNIIGKGLRRLNHSAENESFVGFTKNVISDFNPDIIQIFGSENPFGLICLDSNPPVIIHIQGYLMVWLRKWFSGISKLQQIRYTGLRDMLLMRGSLHGYFVFKKRARREQEILKHCNYFMGRTDFDRRIMRVLSPDSTYFHCEEMIRDKFFEKKWDLPLSNKIKCISILKGTTYKGLELLIETANILLQSTENSYEFMICGVSEDEEFVSILKKRYKRVLSRLTIRFLGRMDAEELVNQICKSNIYVHPSYIENSPNSICEAMALGIPIVATNVGGVSSLITDGVEGTLVQEGEPFSMAGAILEYTTDYDRAKILGQNARKRALKRHNPKEILDTLVRIYNSILDSNGKS
jgi:glycosyltransferase involved in cell wall biosynthesis